MVRVALPGGRSVNTSNGSNGFSGTVEVQEERAVRVEELPPGGMVQVCERHFVVHNLLVRIHSIIVMIWWTGLAPWELEFPFGAGVRDYLCILKYTR